MAEKTAAETPRGLNRVRLVAATLVAVGGLAALATTAWALVEFLNLSQRAQPLPTVREFLWAVAGLLLGWGLGALLWGVAELLRRLDDAGSAGSGVRGPTAVGLDLGPAGTVDPASEHQNHLLEELVHLTRELRDIELLSDAERAARQREEAAELIKRLEQEIPILLREHNLTEAENRLRRARQRFPALPQWVTLAEQLEQARAKFEAHDLALATREVDDLAALGAWDRAVELVRDLRQRHPHSEKVSELVRRVATGRERASAEERARLMSRAQDATTRREWREALQAVETVIARFPDSAEAHDLRLQLPTLKANVEIQVRHEMEATIRDLIRDQRFSEALRIARELIQRYPDSPQAAVLREQLHRLEQRAAELPPVK
ncbi:MAG: hypothetical protein AB1601_08000 [Planctomycetota bacterium]